MAEHVSRAEPVPAARPALAEGPARAMDWCKQIIEGPGGMNVFEDREVVVWHVSDRVAAAHWAIKCLANLNCEGSDKVLEEIIKRRAELRPPPSPAGGGDGPRYSIGKDADEPGEILIADHHTNMHIARSSERALPEVRELVDAANRAHPPAGAGAAMEEMRQALKTCLNVMEMQEQREAGEFHLHVSTFRPMWDAAKEIARRLVAAAEGEG